jgi:hypothetical protein
LLAALRGEADRYNRGVISSPDIHAYMWDQVVQMRDINLTPQQGRLASPIFAEGAFMFRVIQSSSPAAPPGGLARPPATSPKSNFNRGMTDDIIDALPGTRR